MKDKRMKNIKKNWIKQWKKNSKKNNMAILAFQAHAYCSKQRYKGTIS